MKKLTDIEINFLLRLLESEKRGKTRDVLIETAKLGKTDIHFLQIKLEDMKFIKQQ